MQDLHLFLKTTHGERFEYFKTETAIVLPQILSNYLYNTQTRYSVYKIPNYVKDLLIYNKDFSVVYKSKNKYSVIIFKPEENVSKNTNAFTPFYHKVQNLVGEYNKSFNLIVKNETLKPNYPLKADRVAYKDLKEYCNSFCVIDPTNDTMFVFSRISSTETEALEVLFQQYYFKNK